MNIVRHVQTPLKIYDICLICNRRHSLFEYSDVVKEIDDYNIVTFVIKQHHRRRLVAKTYGNNLR